MVKKLIEQIDSNVEGSDSAAKQARLKGLKKKMKEINKYKHHCLRCDGTWWGRNPDPKICSLCNSPYWKTKPTRSNAKPKTTQGRHTTVNFPGELANGVKQAAADEPRMEDRTMSAKIVKIVREAGVPDVSDSEYAKWKAQRKSEGKPFLD